MDENALDDEAIMSEAKRKPALWGFKVMMGCADPTSLSLPHRGMSPGTEAATCALRVWLQQLARSSATEAALTAGCSGWELRSETPLLDLLLYKAIEASLPSERS